jgi:proteasome accessory factor C
MTRPTAGEQLQRILYILPAAARPGGVRIDDLARDLEVTPGRVLADIEEATARAYHHAGGTVDPFSIFVDRERVTVTARHDFNRPVRLNARESLALSLGLRVLAADAAPERRAQITELGTRLEAALTAPDVLPGAGADDGVDYDVALVLDDDAFRGVLADAVTQRVQCVLHYLRPGDDAPGERRVAPYRLVYADGRWYVAALDIARDALRFFRLDRVMDATLLADAAPAPPAGFDAWLAAAPYVAADEVAVAIRYDARVARWIAEHNGTRPDDDGSIVVRHRVADVHWVVRHVLQYGGAAVIEEPVSAREWIVAAVGRLLVPPANR